MLRFHDSVAKTVLYSLVAVTTIVLAAFGALDYYREKTAMEEMLRENLAKSTVRLSTALAHPLWNLDVLHAGKILEGAMLNRHVYAVTVRDADTGTLLAGRSRDKDWNIVPYREGAPPKNLLTKSKPIRYNNRDIGVVQVQAGAVFMERALQNSLANIILRILVLNICLVTIIAYLLRRSVFTPLKSVEAYAQNVSSGREPAAGLGDMRFYGELENLRGAIATMVEQLQAAEKRYRDIVEHATEGVFQTRPDGTFLAANPALARMLAYDSPEEIIHRVNSIGEQMYLDASERDRLVSMVGDTGAAEGFKTRFVRKDGQTIWVVLNARGVPDDKGALHYLEGTVMDVTARERAERRLEILNRHLKRAVRDRTRRLEEKAAELENANRRLTELDELKTTFLATVSHDLRTPLTSVLGFAKLINRDFANAFLTFAGDNPKLARKGHRIIENLGIIQEEGERLTRLINDFLDLSKIEAGRADWRDRDVRAADVIDRAARTVSGDFAEKPDVRLSLDVAASLPVVRMDPDRLSQVMVNLLGNAVKFTETGEVAVRAWRPEEGRIRIEVSDTGRGIAPDAQDKIFDKFQQAGEGDTLLDKPKGTGLGLAICKNIVEHYHGAIRVDSTLQKGSTFIIDLPAHAADTRDPAA